MSPTDKSNLQKKEKKIDKTSKVLYYLCHQLRHMNGRLCVQREFCGPNARFSLRQSHE